MKWDVIVVGAGPGGAASAAFLAREGLSVLVLEKQEFPRFQIGESLLPICLPVLERLGVEPQADSHVFKQGAEFVCERRGQRRFFDFARALPGTPRHAWQVDRAAFDAQLCAQAVESGAEVRHGVTVRRVRFEPDAVYVETNEASHSARYVVDASGQNRLLARHHDTAQPFPGFGHAAAFAHFEGISDAVVEEIGPSHNIQIMIAEPGWGWVIPLANRRLSVGLVTRAGGVADDLERYMKESELISRWTKGTRRGGASVVRNFSFKNCKPSGSRYVCVGDSACFLDPVFSSGVSLALVGAQRMVDKLVPALQQNREDKAELMASWAADMDSAYATFAAIIHRFYHTRFIDHFIFGDTKDEAIERGVVSVLAGDVWRQDNPFQDMLVSSRRQAAFPKGSE